MTRLAFVFLLIVSSSASAASLACFDDASFGAGKWVKVDLKQLPNGKFDSTIEWSTGATSVARNLECRLAVIGQSPALVEGSCERSNHKLSFGPGLYSGTMTIVEDLSRTIGTAFKCERVKKLDGGISWSAAGEFGVDTSTFQSRQRFF
ncbi:MAG: hypothetical protein AAB250_02495 [Bdellovibrionota bacterium]